MHPGSDRSQSCCASVIRDWALLAILTYRNTFRLLRCVRTRLTLARYAFRTISMVLISWFITSAAHACDKPVYLTFDTGHMGIAPLVADVLKRQDVKVTFFIANEPTLPRSAGGTTTDATWMPWWKARALEGHALASHTWNHVVWQRDAADGNIVVKATAGAKPGVAQTLTPQAYCQEVNAISAHIMSANNIELLPVYRAPAGKTSPNINAAMKACAAKNANGYTHIGWSKAGFLGDELSSEQYPNAMLLNKALSNIQAGDVLMAHLGIWSRKDAWAPANLEPLITGLKAKGFCFKTLKEHPEYPHFTEAQKRWGGY
jgi:peptidoglycan-N-acetylmuramic acid deacetylase